MTLRTLSLCDVWIPIVVGAVVGLFAVLFLNYYRLIFSFFNKKLKNIAHGYKILLVFTLTLLLGLVSYSFISTGHHLILELFEGRLPWISLLVLLLVRSSLTLCANSNRITGGIFLPILAIGALVSSLVGKLFVNVLSLDESYYVIILVLGIVACISGMMKMPLTAIIFAVEALSCYDNIMPVIVVSGVAFVITELFGVESINDRVLDNRISEIDEGKSTTLIDRYVTVKEGTFAIGKQVRDVFWPARLIVLSKKRPSGLPPVNEHDAKAMHAGDVLHVRCETFNEKSLNDDLTAILGELE
jgi:H+/Cl- antiporter ClcA